MLFYYITHRSAIIYGGAITLISAVGIAGNVLVLVAVLGSTQMRSSPTNLFLVNLALADSLFILAHFTIWLPRFVLGTAAWMLPWVMCPVTDFAIHAALYASIFTYIAISVERYVAIVHPMRKMRAARQCVSGRRYDNSHRRVLAICVTIWALVAAWWAPNAYATRVRDAGKISPNGSIIVVPTCALHSKMLFESVAIFNAYNWGIRGVTWSVLGLGIGLGFT